MVPVQTIISGTGSFIPEKIVSNKDFAAHNFYAEDQTKIQTDPSIIVDKFKQITGIEERRYADADMNTSDMAAIAGRRALENAHCDPETLDQIIVAHNFGNLETTCKQTDVLPAMASRVKHALKIKNPNCVAYDILFGCPGWLQGVIQADAFCKAGMAKKCLVIGAETLSRVIDEYDRDSMIFADGAGACFIEINTSDHKDSGILATAVQSHCVEEAYYLKMGKSYLPNANPDIKFMKMNGRKVYEYAMKHVPQAMKDCLEKANIKITDLKKVFIHQANEKMDEGIIKALYKLYQINAVPENIMPMSIHKYGNSSVATIPTLFDSVQRGLMLPEHQLNKGDIILFASVGAGMNINAVCYKI